MAPSADQLGLRAVQLGLITERELQTAWADCPTKNIELDEFTQVLIRRELLTNYQIERLKEGNIRGFFYGDYKVLYMVGRGTFARVYRAISKTKEVVALKVLRTKYSNNADFCEQFRREGAMGKFLQHPNIVSIRDFYSEGKTHYFVMEFVEGQSLKDFIRVRRKLTPDEALPIMQDITAGLQFAFSRGFTHRDLKQTNVMITCQGTAKLADFAFATVSPESEFQDPLMRQVSRTLDYAGLERMTKVPRGDPRSDIYFAGCIFYHLLAGEPPLSDTTDRAERINPLRYQEVTPLYCLMPDLPTPLTSLIDKAMALDPERRYQSVSELLRDIVRVKKQLDRNPGDSGTFSLLSQKAMTVEQSIMLVENDQKMQEIFRSSLKKIGFRVLITGEPQRARDLLRDNHKMADCILINSASLGEDGLKLFNQLQEMGSGSDAVPVVLLLGKSQTAWNARAITDERRITVQMPVTMKTLTVILTKLLSKR